MEDTQGQTQTLPRTKDRPRVEPPRKWNVVLIDEQHHSYEYVIKMMQELFAWDQTKALKIAKAVDQEGRAVCLTTHKEHAELKQEQIHGYGPDKYIAGSAGSMTSILEPAEYEGDEDDAR